jgi:hypothetical protein
VRGRAGDGAAAHLSASRLRDLRARLRRLLERWARGDAQPSTPGERQSALRRAAERVETALTGLEEPLKRYLIELEAEVLEGRSWCRPEHRRAARLGAGAESRGRARAAERVAQAYLELAVLVRALEGLTAAARIEATPIESARAGLRPRDNLLGQALATWPSQRLASAVERAPVVSEHP